MDKLNRLRADLGTSRGLTEVASDFHLFEMATNKHFNTTMNNEQSLSPRGTEAEDSKHNFAMQAL